MVEAKYCIYQIIYSACPDKTQNEIKYFTYTQTKRWKLLLYSSIDLPFEFL